MATERRLRARATSIGIVAARALHAGAHGTVLAVFQRSLYVALDGTWCCIGPPNLGAGPLNILCASWGADLALDRLVGVGDAACVAESMLRIGSRIGISLGGAPRWQPPPAPAFQRERVLHGLAAFEAALPPELPAEGLARLIVSEPEPGSSPVLAAARPIQRLCADWATQRETLGARTIDPARMAPLLGLGPGLTPSGDDFLGGAMVALTLAGEAEKRNALWRAIGPLAASHTTEISAAHLAASAEGLGSAALHALLDAVIAGEAGTLLQSLTAVAAIGHTSGWDALAGAVTILRAIAGAPAHRCDARSTADPCGRL